MFQVKSVRNLIYGDEASKEKKGTTTNISSQVFVAVGGRKKERKKAQDIMASNTTLAMPF